MKRAKQKLVLERQTIRALVPEVRHVRLQEARGGSGPNCSETCNTIVAIRSVDAPED